MSTAIIACNALTPYVRAAQEKMGTNYPIVEVDRNHHDRPKLLKKLVEEAMEKVTEDVDTLLVAMGACGNCWAGISWKGTIVIPRMDDCITILLHKDDTWHPNLKKAGHFYQIDEIDDHFSLVRMYERTVEKYGERKAKIVCGMMFGNYTNVDIVDTGVFDCYEKTFVERMQRDADFIRVPLGYTEGSNRIMEKLVSGTWDEQFLVVPPETVIEAAMFLELPSSNEK